MAAAGKGRNGLGFRWGPAQKRGQCSGLRVSSCMASPASAGLLVCPGPSSPTLRTCLLGEPMAHRLDITLAVGKEQRGVTEELPP